MTLRLVNLDKNTREFMISELELDISNHVLYISPRLTLKGKKQYPDLLRQSIQSGNDDSLANALRSEGMLEDHENRHTPSGGITRAKVPSNAANILAEGEFNRFYCRGLCRRAIENNMPKIEVYRAKEVTTPRPGSQEKIGILLEARAVLDDLRRSQGVEPVLGIPPGPNSGLSFKIPG